MTRPVGAPERDALLPEELEAHDRVMARFVEDRGLAKPVPYFAALLNSPLIADHISELGVVYRSRGTRGDSYGSADRVWVDLVLGRQLENGTFYAFMPHAVAYGVRPQAIEALWREQEDALTAEERQLTEYVRAVVSHTVTDEAYAGIERRFGTRGAIEYTAFIGHLLMTLTLMKALGTINYPTTDEQIEERLRAALDGTLKEPPEPIPPITPPDARHGAA